MWMCVCVRMCMCGLHMFQRKRESQVTGVMSFTTKRWSNSLHFTGSRKVSPKCNTGPRPQMQSLAPAVPMAIQGCPFFQVEHAKSQTKAVSDLRSKNPDKFMGIGKVDVIICNHGIPVWYRESWCNPGIPVWYGRFFSWSSLNWTSLWRQEASRSTYPIGVSPGEGPWARNQPSNACSRMHSKILPYFSSSSRCFFWNLASTDSVDLRRVWLKPKMAVLDSCCFVSYSSSSSGQTSCHPGRSRPVTRAGKRPSTWKRLARWRQKHARVSSLSAAWVRLATCHGTAAFWESCRTPVAFWCIWEPLGSVWLCWTPTPNTTNAAQMLSGLFPCKAGLQRPSIGHHSYVVPTRLAIRPSLTTQVYR